MKYTIEEKDYGIKVNLIDSFTFRDYEWSLPRNLKQERIQWQL